MDRLQGRRTDTLLAIADALTQLGFGPVYHMKEVGKNNHQALWIEAIDAKFGPTGKPWGRGDFEKILAGFEVWTVGAGCVVFTLRAARC